MTLLRRILAGAAAVLICSCTTGSRGDACSWGDCLNSGNNRDCHWLLVQLANCKDPQCREELRPTSSQVVTLIGRIDRGNTQGVDLAMRSLGLLGGGDLEDVMRALASLSEVRPALLLRRARANGLTERQLETLICMLPLDSVDKFQLRLQMIRERIEKLQSVKSYELRELRTAAVKSLKECEAEFEKFISDGE